MVFFQENEKKNQWKQNNNEFYTDLLMSELARQA